MIVLRWETPDICTRQRKNLDIRVREITGKEVSADNFSSFHKHRRENRTGEGRFPDGILVKTSVNFATGRKTEAVVYREVDTCHV